MRAKKKRRLVFILIAFLVIALGVVSTVLFIRSRTGADTSKKNTSKSANSYEDLGISEYQYPNQFTLEDELEAAITTVALSYDEFDQNTISEEEWKDEFTRLFLKNSRYAPAYVMDNAENNSGIISKRQAEYVQYSLTGQEIELSGPEEMDIEDNASETMGYGAITSYDEIVDGDTVTLDCSFAVANSADENFSEYYDLKVVLKKNKYSCFNGYSISSLSKEESTIQKQNR